MVPFNEVQRQGFDPLTFYLRDSACEQSSRFNKLRGHNPLGFAFKLRRTRKDKVLSVTRTEVLCLTDLLTNVTQQPC